MSEFAFLRYVNRNVYFRVVHSGVVLWITPVDKPVYNVENYEFSTVIPAMSYPQPVCSGMYIPVHKQVFPAGIPGLRQPGDRTKYPGKWDGWFQFVRKSHGPQPVENRCREKNLCKTPKTNSFPPDSREGKQKVYSGLSVKNKRKNPKNFSKRD